VWQVSVKSVAVDRKPNVALRFLKALGPGLITGAADDDPSAVSSYTVAGARFGHALLWTAPVTWPMMAAVVYISGKVGAVSGMGLAGVLRRYYPRWLLYPVVAAFVVANTLNVGADLGAVAEGLSLLVPVPAKAMVVPITLALLGLQLWGSYRLIERYLRWLTLALLGYVASSFLARPDWGAVLRGTLVPTVSGDPAFVGALVSIVGTTLSPYLYFWLASQQVEEEVSMGRRRLWQRRGASDAELRYLALDVNTGMAVSNLVMYFIILAAAATLHASGQTDVRSVGAAAQALRPLAGEAAGVLFALGFIGVGLLAVPVLTAGAAYALAEACGWRGGLGEPPARARGFYAALTIITLAGMALNFAGLNPIDALVGVAVVNGLLAPVLILLMLHMANNRSIMGHRVNGAPLNALGGLTALATFSAAVGLVVTWWRA
jgi:NRAMP (natural resistance-associated macrophage protein)-like metal ion transporter